MNVKHWMLASSIALPFLLFGTSVRAQIRDADLLEKVTWIARSRGFPCDRAIAVDSEIARGKIALIVTCDVGETQKVHHIDDAALDENA
ncbi:MAG: hypothetical protein AAFY15_06745 [Cyanobacteria bacterium J06648_11]